MQNFFQPLPWRLGNVITVHAALLGKALALWDRVAALPPSVAGLETARAFSLTSIFSRWERRSA
jgi:hypothetical protein